MGISFQRDITEFLFIVERSGEGKKVTNAITIIFNLYTYIRVFMVDVGKVKLNKATEANESEPGEGKEQNLVNLEL
jgi:hypothetical protein